MDSKKYEARVIPRPSRAVRYYRRQIQAAEDEYAAWKQQISEIPQPYRTLTEEEWLEACKYFGRCALCDEPSIDARGLFIWFEEGGRYTVWNVIPLCDRCTTESKFQRNPFRRMHRDLNKSLRIKDGMGRARVDVVKEYLQRRIDEARGA